ncbi:MAG: hypothetical protein WBN20_11115, partial [Eudoraea sp.]
MIAINRSETVLKADPKRVILLFNSLGIGTYTTKNRAEDLVQRVLKLTEAEIEIMYRDLLQEFNHRHKDLSSAFLKFYGHIVDLVPTNLQLSKEKKLLLGAHFAKEYSIQSAALFNPSIVPHPNQENLGEGEKRFIISLRSVGEGHISSIEFREGIISIDGEVTLDDITAFSTHSDKDHSISYNKDQLKLRAATISNFDTSIFEALPSDFTYLDYKA